MLSRLRNLTAAFLPLSGPYTAINHPRFLNMSASSETATFANGPPSP
jgi:hypothetical protein